MARILVIDDDVLTQRVLRLALTLQGHQVLQAFDGDEGVRLFHHASPDVVLTDILMPGQDGLQTIQAIRRTWPGAQIIAMSGGARHAGAPDLLPFAVRCGARFVLYKPFGAAALLAAVNALLADEDDLAVPLVVRR